MASGKRKQHKPQKPRRKRRGPPGTASAARDPLMPAVAFDQTLGQLLDRPPELLPLYAPVLLQREWSSGLPANSCVPASYVLARALHHFGYLAELQVVRADIETHEGRHVSTVGTHDEPHFHGPQNRFYTGHVVVWTESFRRLVDMTIGQAESLRRASSHNPLLTMPMVAQLPRLDPLTIPTAARGEFVLYYHFLPQYTQSLDPFWEDKDRVATLERSALHLARYALGSIGIVEAGYPDRRVPPGPVRDLLDGRRALPDEEGDEAKRALRKLEALRERAQQ